MILKHHKHTINTFIHYIFVSIKKISSLPSALSERLSSQGRSLSASELVWQVQTLVRGLCSNGREEPQEVSPGRREIRVFRHPRRRTCCERRWA